MDLLLENHHLKQIKLGMTPFEGDGSAQIVNSELEKRAKNHLGRFTITRARARAGARQGSYGRLRGRGGSSCRRLRGRERERGGADERGGAGRSGSGQKRMGGKVSATG